MLICDEHKFVFLRNPKTASRSLTKILNQNFNTREIGPYHGQNIPEKYLDYYIFFTVRNPYTRMISTWQHICHQRNWSPEEFTFDKTLKIQSIITRHLSEEKEPVESWWLQSSVMDKFEANVITYENIENDFNNLDFISEKIVLPEIGKQNYGNWKKYYTPEIENKIYKYFRKDFDRFDYKRELNINFKVYL